MKRLGETNTTGAMMQHAAHSVSDDLLAIDGLEDGSIIYVGPGRAVDASLLRAMVADLNNVVASATGALREWRDRALKAEAQRDAAHDALVRWASQTEAAEAERDMLARQLAEANRYIRDRIDMDAEDEAANGANGDVFNAIEVHQRQGVR